MDAPRGAQQFIPAAPGHVLGFPLKAESAAKPAPAPKRAARPKKLSRAARWADALSRAQDGISALIDLQQEYRDWRDGLPENLESSTVAGKLDAVIDLDIEGAQDMLNEAEGVDLPLGFGRD
jgi:hypothetical protein